MDDELTFDNDEMGSLQKMIESDDLDGVAYFMCAKMENYFNFTPEIRDGYYAKLKNFLNENVYLTYQGYKGKTIPELKEELEANLQGYVGMMDITGSYKNSKPPSGK